MNKSIISQITDCIERAFCIDGTDYSGLIKDRRTENEDDLHVFLYRYYS